MYCSQCGKKVMDTMLFCPFCGSPIVIPEQDEPSLSESSSRGTSERDGEPAQVIVEREQAANIPDSPVHEAAAEEAEEFVPLNVEAVGQTEQLSEIKTEDSSEETIVQPSREEPVRLHGLKPDLSVAGQLGAPQIASVRKNTDTLVPQRKFDPNDMFLDSNEEDEYDYDDYDDDDYEDDDYDDGEEIGFWVRHIRGLVSLALLLVVAAVLIGWSFSNSGQQALARADLAWRPSAYAEIAYDAYQNMKYSQAGSYYLKAAGMDPDNYDYVSSAGVAYYMAQDSANAEEMAQRAIRIDPTRINAYELLLRLYPDASARPVLIQQQLQSGYEKTGDARLAPAQ